MRTKSNKQQLRGYWRALRLLVLLVIAGCMPIMPDGEFEPSGTQFYVKSTIEVKRITGSLANFDTTAANSLDLTATSRSSGSESDVLPAGLILVSTSPQVAHMILLKDYPIRVPAGRDTIITIGTFDCNSRRAAPSNNNTYTVGPVTDHQDLRRIVTITRHKRLGSGNVSYIQDVVRYVTDGGALRQSSIDSLNALPEG